MKLVGKNINLRSVELDDADFIYKMRQNEVKTRFLTKVTGTLESQKKWISKYKQREYEQKEFYFVIESKSKEKLGLARMYDFKDNSFCWGNWLIKEDAPKSTAIESALQIYEFGFYKQCFKRSHFNLRKGNDKVISFHQRFGAKIVDEDELDYFFNFEKSDYEIIKEKYKRYL
jgi:RimJ/RimL family protein N-acetyltransferase